MLLVDIDRLELTRNSVLFLRPTAVAPVEDRRVPRGSSSVPSGDHLFANDMEAGRDGDKEEESNRDADSGRVARLVRRQCCRR